MQRCHPDEKFIVFVCTVNEIAISLNTREYGEGKRDHVFIIVRADYATLPFRPFGKKVLVKLATCYKSTTSKVGLLLSQQFRVFASHRAFN